MGAFTRTEFLCISVLRVASGPRLKLVGRKSALNAPVVYSADRSRAAVLELFLLFVLFLSKCAVMLALRSPSTTAHAAFCFTICD